MNRLIFLFIAPVLCTQAQQTNFEQMAFNYFSNEIFNKNYPDADRIYYCGETESERSIAGPFAKCFETDINFTQFFYQQKKSESEKLTIDSNSFHQFKKSAKSKSKKLNLIMYRAVTNDGVTYVYIKVFKVGDFVDHYLIKIFSNKVVDVCYSNEII